MVPGECTFEADIRLPVGVAKETVMAEVEKIAARFPEASLEETNCNLPSYCDPYGTMMGIIQKNVEELKGFQPKPVVSLGGTDARLWRYIDVPAYVYGPFPANMGAADEYVEVEEYLHIVRHPRVVCLRLSDGFVTRVKPSARLVGAGFRYRCPRRQRSLPGRCRECAAAGRSP